MKQWKYLRAKYIRSPNSSWELAPYLSFLKPFIIRRPRKDNSDLPSDSSAVSHDVKRKNLELSIYSNILLSSEVSSLLLAPTCETWSV